MLVIELVPLRPRERNCADRLEAKVQTKEVSESQTANSNSKAANGARNGERGVASSSIHNESGHKNEGMKNQSGQEKNSETRQLEAENQSRQRQEVPRLV